MYIVLKHYKRIDSYNITSFSCSSESEAVALVAALNLAEKDSQSIGYKVAHIL